MKGIEYFIRAAALIHRRRPDSWFLISGSTYSGPPPTTWQRLQEEIRASGVPPERFIWADGPPDDRYPALDLMLIASYRAPRG